MTAGIHLAWLQLTEQKGHFAAALAGVAFAVTLMLGQIGLRDSLLTTATRVYSHLNADVVMTSWQYQFQQGTGVIPQQRFAQALAVSGVVSCAPLYIGWAALKNPEDHQEHQIVLLGIDPAQNVFRFDGQSVKFDALTERGTLLFDELSRAMFGPIAAQMRARQRVKIQASHHEAGVAGLFRLGPGFGTDGHLIASDSTYRVLTAGLSSPLPALGLIRLMPGADPRQAVRNLAAALPSDVRFVTMPDFLEQEKSYWLRVSPIGFVFTAGLLMGLVVGSVVVYQILYTDVSNHRAEYATMKAMGYRDMQLSLLVLRQAGLMSVLGFIPGALMADAIYVITRNATLLPLEMNLQRSAQVYLLTLLMCAGSGVFAMLALRKADPAEIFG
jgi:putative ABC transport system permease protein